MRLKMKLLIINMYLDNNIQSSSISKSVESCLRVNH